MEFNVNLGMWSSVFAVPSQIVDNYIKLAGVTQLKVILWILRHGGEKITLEEISQNLGKSEDDVNDALQFWCELGVINIDNNTISPKSQEIENKKDTNTEQILSDKNDIKVSNDKVKVENNDNKQRPLSRVQKPDSIYIAERINSSKEIAYLMQEAQVILGRTISVNDSGTLLMLHENDGLPIEIIIMIMQYAVSNGKSHMSYIEKMGINWAKEEIFTIETAEEKLKRLEESKKYANIIQSIFGLQKHSPTSKEEEYATRWLGEYKFSREIIRYAYEICINSIGQYKANYINKILSKWYSEDLKSIDEIEQYNNKNKQKKEEQEATSYNIEEYENNYDIFNVSI